MFKRDIRYEQILRPLFEARSTIGWAVAAVWCLGIGLFLSFGRVAVLSTCLLALTMAVVRGLSLMQLAKQKMWLIGKPVEMLPVQQLQAALPKLQGNLWLGWGYRWQPRHTRRAYEIMKHDVEAIYPPKWVLRLMGNKRNPADEKGIQWIHGLEADEGSVVIPFDSLKGHCAVIAITGAIKTRLIALVVYQLVARGDCVIAIDPKGDKEFREICRLANELNGRPEKFLFLHPAFATKSVRFDMLKNWDRVSQVASRVSLVLGSQEESTFKEFCWKAVHSLTNGLKYLGQRISIHTLKSAMESRGAVERITEDVLVLFFERHASALKDSTEQVVNQLSQRQKDKKPMAGFVETGSIELTAMISVFQKSVPDDKVMAREMGLPEKPAEIKGLISILEANKEWFGKMIVSITPMLTKLSTDDLRDLLSPDYDDTDDTRPIMDMKRVVEGGFTLYIGTDALADKSVGSAISSMALADAAAVCAEIYNHGIEGDDGTEPRRVHVIGDEWGDLMCEALIQQANKGRGAGYFIWALGQTFADLEVALGSRSQALRFMGNMNNLIVGATQDPDTMDLIAKKLGETAIEVKSQGQGMGSRSEDWGLEFTSNQSESISDKVSETFPRSLLAGLPDLQYLAHINRSMIIKGRIPVVTLK